jgi:hypothetical protein
LRDGSWPFLVFWLLPPGFSGPGTDTKAKRVRSKVAVVSVSGVVDRVSSLRKAFAPQFVSVLVVTACRAQDLVSE